ncbi:phage terminase small subunit P27 family [uncultured Roseovarius sp.]|uniref:phage terminase small subunit P27 family n=1 Tax=uncultured Roseovarius sp. TaxID=293344 RepID=UPI002619DDF8|nr:phage terminase small subunit P27 family [uncultured Roseovarius sp.]
MGRSRAGEAEPIPPKALPRCPDHLSKVARKEWRRLAAPLYRMGVLSVTDRAALAAYCQAWARWVEAEEHLSKGPALIKTPSGYVQQSPWLTVANKQLEIMGRFMAELGLSPSARARLRLPDGGADTGAKIEVITLIAAGDRAEDDRNVLPVNVRVSEG